MRRYAGFIGRFQPWHKGHQLVLEEMVAEGYQPVLFLGSANGDRDLEKNPFTFEERRGFITQACRQLSYPDGNPVAPLFIPLFDFPRLPHEQPFFENGEKRVPLNSRWFGQFVDFFREQEIKSQDFTLFYVAKDSDRKNYVFQKNYREDKATFTLPGACDGIVAENEDLSFAFTLIGAARREVKESPPINATDIRQDLFGRKEVLVNGTFVPILATLQGARKKNQAYDGGQDISDQAFSTDPFAVMRHERRARDNNLFKLPSDPAFHKRVMLIGGDGALGTPIIKQLLERSHDLVLLSPDPDALKRKLSGVENLYPGADITHIPVDLRQPKTWATSYWEELYTENKVNAVIDMAGIIEEKPETGLTFEAINYKPVPAMAEACIQTGIDRFIYFSTMTAGIPEAETNARQDKVPLTYAGAKRKAEMALEKLGGALNWFALRPVTTYNPDKANWGRDMTLPDLANLPIVPVWGSGNQPMQPLYIRDLAKIARLVESNQKGGEILKIVGPEQLTVRRIMEIVRAKDDFPAVHVAHHTALKLADNYPLGGINRAFMKVCQKLETPPPAVDAKLWATRIGEDGGLSRLSEIYNRTHTINYASPPIAKYVRQISENPGPFLKILRENGAEAELLQRVERVMKALHHMKEEDIVHLPGGGMLLGRAIVALGAQKNPPHQPRPLPPYPTMP